MISLHNKRREPFISQKLRSNTFCNQISEPDDINKLKCFTSEIVDELMSNDFLDVLLYSQQIYCHTSDTLRTINILLIQTAFERNDMCLLSKIFETPLFQQNINCVHFVCVEKISCSLLMVS